jgi:hypothetical protein
MKHKADPEITLGLPIRAAAPFRSDSCAEEQEDGKRPRDVPFTGS